MTNGDLVVGVTLEKRATNTDIIQNNCDYEHLETKYLPHKKRNQIKNISESTPKSSIKKVKFTCEICGHESAQQFEFYTHLKIHYEKTKHVDFGAVDLDSESNPSISEPKRLNKFEKEEILSEDTLVLNSKDVILVIPENILGIKTSQENEDGVDLHDECEDLETVVEEAKVVFNENASNVSLELLKSNENIKVQTEETIRKVIKKTKTKCDKKYPCNSCGKILLSSAAKTVHQRIHSDSRPFPCTVCGICFRQLGDLRYHKQSKHSEIPEFQCEFCGKEFARKYSLTLHRKIHTGELSHPCDLCDKSFRAAVYLQNHRRIHTGEKPFSCSKCSKKFRVKSDVNRHLKVHEARELKGSSKFENSHVLNHQVVESQMESFETELIIQDHEEGLVVNHEDLLDGGGLLDVRMVLN